jgi:hypothetical protein
MANDDGHYVMAKTHNWAKNVYFSLQCDAKYIIYDWKNALKPKRKITVE